MEPIEINCPDPRFDPARPVIINGFAYAPALEIRDMQARIAELEAFERRIRSAIEFVEPQNDEIIKSAIAADLHKGMSLRKCAEKHGTTVAIVRGVARIIRD